MDVSLRSTLIPKNIPSFSTLFSGTTSAGGTMRLLQQNYEIKAKNLLGHVGRLLGVADELVLALRQP